MQHSEQTGWHEAENRMLMTAIRDLRLDLDFKKLLLGIAGVCVCVLSNLSSLLAPYAGFHKQSADLSHVEVSQGRFF